MRQPSPALTFPTILISIFPMNITQVSQLLLQRPFLQPVSLYHHTLQQPGPTSVSPFAKAVLRYVPFRQVWSVARGCNHPPAPRNDVAQVSSCTKKLTETPRSHSLKSGKVFRKQDHPRVQDITPTIVKFVLEFQHIFFVTLRRRHGDLCPLITRVAPYKEGV